MLGKREPATQKPLRVLLFCTYLLLILWGGSLYAQTEDASALYQKAEKSYKLQKYNEALEDFQRSYELSNEAAILFNIGQCYRQLDQLEEAKKSFAFFIRDAEDHPKRSAAEKLIKEIDAKLKEKSGSGSIQIASKQQAIELFVDGVSRGKPPLLLEDIPPGEHLITAKQEGFADYELSIVVKASQRVELNIPRLVPLSGATNPARPFFLGAAGLGTVSIASFVVTGLAIRNARNTINFSIDDADTNNDNEVDVDELIAQGVAIADSIDAATNRSLISTTLLTMTAASAITGLILQKKNKTEAK